MIWDKTITADRATATPEQQETAWKAWLAGDSHTAHRLVSELLRAGAISKSKFYPCSNIAGLMLQRARKAGEIRWNGGSWEIVGRP